MNPDTKSSNGMADEQFVRDLTTLPEGKFWPRCDSHGCKKKAVRTIARLWLCQGHFDKATGKLSNKRKIEIQQEMGLSN